MKKCCLSLKRKKRNDWKLETTFWCCLVVALMREQWRLLVVDPQRLRFSAFFHNAKLTQWNHNLQAGVIFHRWDEVLIFLRSILHNSFVSVPVTNHSFIVSDLMGEKNQQSRDLCSNADIMRRYNGALSFFSFCPFDARSAQLARFSCFLPPEKQFPSQAESGE